MTPGRATTAYASMYALDDVHQSRCFRAQKRKYGVLWKGALEAGVKVSSVTWYTDSPFNIVMSNPEISDDQLATYVMVLANNDGQGTMKCEVLLNNGEIRNMMFLVWIKPQYSLFGAGQGAAGPTSVTTSAIGFVELEDEDGDTPFIELEDA